MNLEQLFLRKILPTLLPSPVKARHSQYSMLYSADDERGQASNRLISIAMDAVKKAQEVSLKDINSRLNEAPYYPDIWPGEHYKLLAGLVVTLRPKIVVEIGTYTGISALTMKKFLDPEAKLYTFDIFEWHTFKDTCMKKEDFSDGKLIQCIDDLTDPSALEKHRAMLESADLIFIDAAKDGSQEQKFLDNFEKIRFKTKPIFVFDDIRVWNMLKIWREINRPKLDLTSFGHWAGTGLVEW